MILAPVFFSSYMLNLQVFLKIGFDCYISASSLRTLVVTLKTFLAGKYDFILLFEYFQTEFAFELQELSLVRLYI